MFLKLMSKPIYDSELARESSQILSDTNPCLGLGHRFIHHSESYHRLILKGLETPHSSISDFLMKFQSARTKELRMVVLILQMGRSTHKKAKSRT